MKSTSRLLFIIKAKEILNSDLELRTVTMIQQYSIIIGRVSLQMLCHATYGWLFNLSQQKSNDSQYQQFLKQADTVNFHGKL